MSALLALARADRATAHELLAEALAAEPQSVVARVVLSHVEQSAAALDAAERTLRAALAIEPDNAIVLTRLAEVALAKGDARAAITNASRARSLAPTQSTPLVVLGFANLRAFDTAAAETAFRQAAELEREAPLPRLGLALALIQRGEELAGRRQLELAVALDPANPLTRSYMARVYESENRGDLTASQLDLAKEFDPVDPTPWLYSSLQNLRANRPVEALQDYQLAAQKNDGRPIFRSWLSLDEDVATRSAELGRVHNELGFGQLALRDARQAIGDDPTNFAAHRLLAAGYSTEPWHEIARVSELYVAQLLQPANVAPIKPQLGQQNLFIAQRAGPSHTSFDELASPVITNGLKVRASAVGGSNGSSGDDVSLAGLHDRVSYSVGHYRFATDGFRTNNDLEQEVANAFLQYRPNYETNLQAELRSSRTEHGDLTMYFNRESYSPSIRQDEDADSLRLGGKHQFSPNHILLGSLILQEVAASSTSGDLFSLFTEQNAHNVDIQDTVRVGRTIVQSGFISTQQDETWRSTQIFEPGMDPVVGTIAYKNRQQGVYSYVTLNPTATLTLTAGASVDTFEIGGAEDDAVSPKLGLVWRPTALTTVRAAAFETLHNDLTTSSLNTQPHLEPTQVAGFTQLLLGGRGDQATVSGIAIEHELSPDLFIGWQADARDTDSSVLVPFADSSLPVALSERVQNAYLYWMPRQRLSLSGALRARALQQRARSDYSVTRT